MSATGRHSAIRPPLAARPASRHAVGFGAVRPAVLGLARLLLLPLASAAPLGIWTRGARILEEEDGAGDVEDVNLWVYLSVAVALVLLGGAFAGLTIALMGQDETYLQVIATSGEGSERKHAQKVLDLLKKGKHWVLVTLLLSNVITNETLPIVLDRSLGGGWPAVLSSTVLIVIFGEVAPQSICVRYGLSIGAFMAPVVVGLMWIMFPVAWPTAKLLDYLLGEDHGTTYKKAGLKTLVQLHKTLGTTPGERLMQDEVDIISSVLDLKDKAVCDVMTPMQDVFTMSADTVLDERMMDTLLTQGYSRIPVYAPDNHRNFIGMLLVKILITYDPEDCMRVRDFALATLPETSPYTSCLDIINFFQEGKSHMVLVSEQPGTDKGAMGVVTLEDVIEELIGEEIVDESDVFVDVHKAIRRLAPAEQKRYRLGKAGQLVEVDDNVNSESEREGKADNESTPLIPKTENVRPGMPQSQGTTFMMRRKSSTASDSTRDVVKPLPMRSNTTDLRQHLKHLGPSNAASKPRATKYTSVKIKPAVGTIPENQATTAGGADQTQRSRSADHQATNGDDDNENTALLSTAGGEASNGVAALQANGYGSNDVSPARQRGLSEPDKPSPGRASQIAEENTAPPLEANRNDDHEEADDYLEVPPKMVIGPDGTEITVSDNKDDDTVGDMEGPSRQPRKPTRSGSITESTVDVGGVKKVVLETTSSSDEVSPSDGSRGNMDGTGDKGKGNGDKGQSESKKPKKKKKGKKKGTGF